MLAHELLEGLEFHEVPLRILDLATPIAQHQQSLTQGKRTVERLIHLSSIAPMMRPDGRRWHASAFVSGHESPYARW